MPAVWTSWISCKRACEAAFGWHLPPWNDCWQQQSGSRFFLPWWSSPSCQATVKLEDLIWFHIHVCNNKGMHVCQLTIWFLDFENHLSWIIPGTGRIHEFAISYGIRTTVDLTCLIKLWQRETNITTQIHLDASFHLFLKEGLHEFICTIAAVRASSWLILWSERSCRDNGCAE